MLPDVLETRYGSGGRAAPHTLADTPRPQVFHSGVVWASRRKMHGGAPLRNPPSALAYKKRAPSASLISWRTSGRHRGSPDGGFLSFLGGRSMCEVMIRFSDTGQQLPYSLICSTDADYLWSQA